MSSPTAFHLSSPSQERKRLGAYYTPPAVAEALVRWAVGRGTKRVLDPSFGDGRVLAAAGDRLRAVGVRAPGQRLFGVEVGSRIGDLPLLRRARVPAGNLLERDFFETDLDTWDRQRFDAIVGNPPYVRHHLLSAESKQLARRRAEHVGISLNERADAWAYFCVALLDYLVPRGRLALLLPGAVLHAEYALPLLHRLSTVRGHVRLIRVRERLFEDAVERTIVLLLDGRRSEPGVDYREVADVAALAKALNGRTRSQPEARPTIGLGVEIDASPALRLRTRLRWFISQPIADLWERIAALPEVERLGDIAQIRIGVVTGANAFFVVSAEQAALMCGRRVATASIVSRGSWLRGTSWTQSDHSVKADKPSQLLLIEPAARPREALRRAIDKGNATGIPTRSHCRKREKRNHWYCLTDSAAPDLFLPYMGAGAPRLVLNQARATCTNAIHRVDLITGQHGAAAVAAASWTSLHRLTAELVGRSYGGGVLKLEPGEAAELRLPLLPAGAEHLLEIERVRVASGVAAAQERGDELLLEEGLGISREEVELMRVEAADLQAKRGT